MKKVFSVGITIFLAVAILVTSALCLLFFRRVGAYDYFLRQYNEFNKTTYVPCYEDERQVREEQYDKKALNRTLSQLKEDQISIFSFYSYLPDIDESGFTTEEGFITKEMAEFADLQVQKGRTFGEGDFQDTSCIPILIGDGLQRRLRLGQKMEFSHGPKTFHTEVVGILKKGQEISNLFDIAFNLDKTYLFPISDQMIAEDFQMSDYHMFMQSAILPLNNEQDAEKVEDLLNRSGFYHVKMTRLDHLIDDFEEETIHPIKMKTAVFCLLDLLLFFLLFFHLQRRKSAI